MKTLFTYLLFFTTVALQAQTLSGTVTSDTETPLENANVMAKAINGKTGIKFSIADHLGRYKLELEKETDYQVTVHYMGYESASFTYNYANPVATYDFVLIDKGEELKEIVIDYDYQPIVVKKDTIVYDVAAFMNGNERKLKDQLEKLPGVEVTDEGQVKVQGKTVTQFLVEGNSFFGGGTKLGVENIPADAVDKVEVIDHFTQVGHMKEVSGSDDLAMNIKLKEDKKKFVFGDLRLGYGNNKYYDTGATLFYYSPTFNWSVIANANNYGAQQLTYDDIIRFEGFKSVFVRSTVNQKQLFNLYSYLQPNTDVAENKNQFLASDVRYAFNKKWDVKGLFLLNKNWIRSQTDQSIQYLQSDDVLWENRWNSSNRKNSLISGKLSADFKKDKNTTFNYNIQLAATNNSALGNVLSESATNNKELSTQSQVDNLGISQLFEAHKTFNKKHKASFAAVHTYNKETPEYNWFSNEAFLGSYIPWQSGDAFRLNEIQNTQQHTVQLNAKHYWIATKKHHMYATLGYNGAYTNLNINNAFTTNNTWENLSEYGFGNQLQYRLNNPFVGVEHKFLYKKFTSTVGLFVHTYHLQNTYPTESYQFSTFQLEPEIKLEYEFTNSESLNFNYNINNSYLGAESYAHRWQMSSFNSLFKGNAVLQNLQYQSASLRYSKHGMYSGTNKYFTISYNKRNKNIRNQVELIGVDQFYETVMSDQPDSNINASAYYSKRIKKVEFNGSGVLGFSRYTQVTNTVELPSKRDYQMIGVGFKTLFKENPNVEFNYNKSFSQLESSFTNTSTMDSFSIKAEARFLKHFVWKADYHWMSNSFSNQKTTVEQMNSYIEYNKKNSPWLFMIKGNNLLNTGIKNEINFSDFIISNTNTYILPRVVLFSIQYKL